MKYLRKFNESIITNGHNITMKQWDGYVATVEDFEILGELLQSEVFDEYLCFILAIPAKTEICVYHCVIAKKLVCDI
jgi:hypothetical protein